MPRLLLVDDNPSIHKIAESLLAHTQIDLVCTDSGPKALECIESSAPFDVALIDISMADMDGWELLERLRAAPGTARLPIAMMAGVLDTVDPDRLAKAPVQGFIKKPVELRDLAERIQVLLDTPVPEPAPTPIPEAASPFETLPAQSLADLQAALDMDDVLELDEEDLFPEEEAPLPAEVPTEMPVTEDLDLEELDLDGLKELGLPEEAEPAEAPLETVLPDLFGIEDLPDLVSEDARSTQEVPLVPPAPLPEAKSPEPASLEEPLISPFPEPVEEFSAETVAASPEELPAQPGHPTAQALVAAIMADPALMGALAKAVAAQLSETTLREVAWEIMPEIAERQKLL